MLRHHGALYRKAGFKSFADLLEKSTIAFVVAKIAEEVE
jgi:hypothetical protein